MNPPAPATPKLAAPLIVPEAMAGAADRAARLPRLMGHDGRLMPPGRLAQGEASVGALGAKLGIRQWALSQHRARLRRDGVVVARRDGARIHYRLASPEAARPLATLQELFCS